MYDLQSYVSKVDKYVEESKFLYTVLSNPLLCSILIVCTVMLCFTFLGSYKTAGVWSCIFVTIYLLGFTTLTHRKVKRESGNLDKLNDFATIRNIQPLSKSEIEEDDFIAGIHSKEISTEPVHNDKKLIE